MKVIGKMLAFGLKGWDIIGWTFWAEECQCLGSPKNGELPTVSNPKTGSSLFLPFLGPGTEAGIQAHECWEGIRPSNL